MARFDGDLSIVTVLDGELSDEQIYDGEVGEYREITNFDYYEGPYTVTPSASTQTLSMAHLMASQNVVIDPIPSNYGLITWNGATLTVS